MLIRIVYLILSILIFLFIGGISLAGGHGHLNSLTIMSIIILITGIFTIYNKDKKSKINSIISIIIIFSLGLFSHIKILIKMMNNGNPRGFMEFKFIQYVLIFGLTLLLILFIDKINKYLKKPPARARL